MRPPLKSRKTKCTFCYKSVAFNRFIWYRYPVVFRFIISSKYPYFTFVFYTYLRAANNMSGGMQAKFDIVNYKSFTPFFTSHINLTKTMSYNRNISVVCDIRLMPISTMICMTMRNNGFIYRFPRIEIYIGCCTKYTFVVKL
nr:hypothetical protein [uncultured bacterium]